MKSVGGPHEARGLDSTALGYNFNKLGISFLLRKIIGKYVDLFV